MSLVGGSARSLGFSICLVLGLVLSPTIEGGQRQFYRCAKYLSLLPDTLFPDTLPSAHERAMAMNFLTRFRGELLAGVEPARTSKPTYASHASSPGKMARVASRVEGILSEGPQHPYIWSTVGTENILAELERRSQFGLGYGTEQLRQDVVTAGLSVVTAAILAIAYWTWRSPNYVTPVLLWSIGWVPETFIRSLGLYTLRGSEERRLEHHLTDLGEGQWYFHSFAQTIDAKLLQRIREHGFAHGDMVEFWEDLVTPHLTGPYTGRRFSSDPKRAWRTKVKFDEVLAFDPQSGEPTLLTIIRMSLPTHVSDPRGP